MCVEREREKERKRERESERAGKREKERERERERERGRGGGGREGMCVRGREKEMKLNEKGTKIEAKAERYVDRCKQ